MEFQKPEKLRIYNLLSNSKELNKVFIENNIIITRQDYINSYGVCNVNIKSIDLMIQATNREVFDNLSELLLNNSKKILSTSVAQLVKENFLKNEINSILGKSFNIKNEILSYIYYVYKYSYSECFFEKNVGSFIPEYDLEEFRKNEEANVFLNTILKEFDKFSEYLDTFSNFYSYDEIPFECINYLTSLLGFSQEDFLISNEQEELFRELSKNILDIYKIKGTSYSFQLMFDFLGLEIKLDNYYFDRRLFYKIDEKNEETGTSDKKTFLYYLTTTDPTENKLENNILTETVSSSTLGDFLDIFSFDEQVIELTKIHNNNTLDKSIKVLLGYDEYYFDKFGRNVKWEGPVYTYFRTNYLNLKPKNRYSESNLTIEQTNQIGKLVNFLVPVFMKRETTLFVNQSDSEEPLGLSLDRKKLYILDGQTWSSNYKEKSVIIPKPVGSESISSKPCKIITSNGYIEDYKDSIGFTSYVDENKKVYEIYKDKAKEEETKKTKSLNEKIGNISKTTLNSYYCSNTMKDFERKNKKRKKVDWLTDCSICEFLLNGNDEFNKTSLVNTKNSYWKQVKTFCNEADALAAAKKYNVINYSNINDKLIIDNMSNINICNGSYNTSNTDSKIGDILNNSSNCDSYLIMLNNNKYNLYHNTTFDYEKEVYSEVLKKGNYIDKLGVEKSIYEKITCEEYYVDYKERKFLVKSCVDEAVNLLTKEKAEKINNQKKYPYIWRPLPEENINSNKIIKSYSTYKELYNSFSCYSKYNNTDNLNSRFNDTKLGYNMFNVCGCKYVMKKTLGNYKFITKDKGIELSCLPSLSEADIYNIGQYVYSNNIFDDSGELKENLEKYENELLRYEYSNRKNGQLIYSTKDCKLYMITNKGFVLDGEIFGVKHIDFFGRLKIEEDGCFIYDFDKDFLHYNEKSFVDNGIFYNSSKEIKWKEMLEFKDSLSFDSRPTKDKTDKIFLDNELSKKIIAYLYGQTAYNFSEKEIPFSIKREVW